MVGRDPPPIRGAEEKVSSFLGVEIGELSYLFILLALQTRYLTEVREQLLRHVDAFGEDLGEGGKVVHAYEASRHQTFREVAEKRWPDEVRTLLRHKLATLSRDGHDLFSYLNALRRRERLGGVIKYLKIDKVGAFGIFVDIEAILADAVGTGS